jgi:Glycosyl hydrolase family 26/Ig domain of plant-specific actin-binding protein
VTPGSVFRTRHRPTSGWRRWIHRDALTLLVVGLLVTVPAGGAARNGSGNRAPRSASPPTISGSPVVGNTLTAGTGSWSGQVRSYAYQWIRCDSTGNGCSSITGAKSSSYAPVSTDVGHTLRVSVTASNKWGSTVATSAATSVVTAPSTATVSPPSNTSLPTISGTATVGQTLTASTGTWSGSPTSYAYQWKHCDSSGASCGNISGATSASYGLTSSDAGYTMRVTVTASNSGGSASTTSTQTAAVATSTSSTTGTSYPASFYSGPAGTNVLLPPSNGYPSKGAWIGEASGNGLTQVHSREQYFGRKFNIYSYYAQNRCDPWPTILADAAAAGYIPMISWFPNPYYADQIISGQADSCIRSFGNAIANQSAKVLIRPYWEFNGGWYNFSKNSNGTRATATQEKQMWQHTIDVLRTTNAFARASVVWCPHEGYYNNGDAYNNPTPYPGDTYVDWVCSDYYNHNMSTAWCGVFHAGWCAFAEMFTHGYYAPTYTPRGVEHDFRGKKPYIVGETGSLEDTSTPGRKGQWMIAMGNYAKTYMPGLYGIVYFDLAHNGEGFNLDTSTSSMDGFKSFANDSYFKVPNN